MIANLAGNKSLQLIVKDIRKNRVQFRMMGGDYDTVTLISQPKYYAVHITREVEAETPTHEVCSAVRGMVESTLKTVTSRMNYSFCAEYQLSFECPSHPGRDHLCTVEKGRVSPLKGDSYSTVVKGERVGISGREGGPIWTSWCKYWALHSYLMKLQSHILSTLQDPSLHL